ncbi:hypothetical protein K437DRAFT_268148 [Tilletiaria anomala UBC 951]|uniref:Uncharacterized protein n=1 Tax=Tilletiaria anomala (strain ATCC 24038 / CBS 436.72 / UBC 951) TaxID=1037660 RepID=A0A066W669_TILAU|nr:uncharacterized protein K437DRAFT_268148 [Tilletiaria anomala UBC 951]KDN46265.1 hypothetical protein K437DRAFT_268148 [Tilletiaria anomala UBC 951]
MGKKAGKNADDGAVVLASKKGPDGGVLFSSSDAILNAVAEQVKLTHITKPWTRDAWERAKPWVLEQRQKLEGMGWASADVARTELYVLKKNAPHGADTDDGFLYIRIPKKFIDFMRCAKGDDPAAEDEAAGEDGKKKKRVVKKKENAPSYELSHPEIWRIRIDADTETSDREANVLLDVAEPLENIFYLLQVLQPGLARIHASRKDVIQPGTMQSGMRDDAEAPTVRHRAQVAASESYMRTLPPAFWLKRNEGELRKILTEKTFDETLKAAEEGQARGATERTVKDIKEKVWEEQLKMDQLSVKDKKKKGSASAESKAAA